LADKPALQIARKAIVMACVTKKEGRHDNLRLEIISGEIFSP
jgi:hypothetical protein